MKRSEVIIKDIKQEVQLLSNACERLNLSKSKCWIDSIVSLVLFGATPRDYFRYEFYKKNYKTRNTFVTFFRSKKIIRTSNRDYSDRIDDKDFFNTLYDDLIKRQWIDCDINEISSIKEFISKHYEVIMKPKYMSKGKGIYFLDINNLNEIGTYNINGYIAEEVLVQNKAISMLNETSVNTVRVNTYCGEIIGSVLRIGKNNSRVDNVSQGGSSCHINIETGRIDSNAIANDNQSSAEKINGITVKGMQIPNWEKIQEVITIATQRTQNNYIGWDIAILEDDVALIEANTEPGHRMQMGSQIGWYSKIKRINNENRRRRKTRNK